MHQHVQHQVRQGVGIVGNVISFGLFLSPIPTVFGFWKKKTVEEFHPWTFVFGILNCCLWIMYGAPKIHPDSTLVWTINSVGLVLYVVYLSIYVWYAPKPKMLQVFGSVGAVAIVDVIVALPVLLVVHVIKTRTLITGILAVIFNVCLYAGPLTVLGTVYRTKSVEYLPIWICSANLANGIIWSTYALLSAPIDPMILTGNGIGTVLGLIQIGLHVWYGSCWGNRKVASGGDDLKKPDKPSEVQLETVKIVV
ncbi:OLC1v1012216C1 [Oldenlandia corymbosa var. corymbosa]|uniref:Bidirectional sugar transporter SWEET n=1 Tax=Oldenlandia corymbosa var. corymbosa TaxID=529605 RepID=A0AAV1DVH4_OLDCO|nr:OLC1v1012216C1 [Oldenlandia corymbosa var. corymbosa]